MVSRAETAAATRRALLDAAAELLDEGGLDAVTLREVGARAGVSRGAPYRHFPDKERLLIAVGVQAWEDLADHVHALRKDASRTPAERLRGSLGALIALGRERPHLYRMMFSSPGGDPTAFARAARRSQDEFLAVLADLTGPDDVRRLGALLIGSANGIAGLEVSGQLADPKWGGVSSEDLVHSLVDLLAAGAAQ